MLMKWILTKAEALRIQAEHIAWYSPHCSDLAARVAAITTADELEDGREYPIEVINKHIPRGGDIERICGLS